MGRRCLRLATRQAHSSVRPLRQRNPPARRRVSGNQVTRLVQCTSTDLATVPQRHTANTTPRNEPKRINGGLEPNRLRAAAVCPTFYDRNQAMAASDRPHRRIAFSRTGLFRMLVLLLAAMAQSTDIYTADEDLATGSFVDTAYEVNLNRNPSGVIIGFCQHDHLHFSNRYTTSGQLTALQCKAWCDAAVKDCVGYSYSLQPGRDCGGTGGCCAFHKRTPSTTVPNHAGGSTGIAPASRPVPPDSGFVRLDETPHVSNKATKPHYISVCIYAL